MRADPRRHIPGTDTLLASPEFADALRSLDRHTVKSAVVRAQQLARTGQITPGEVADVALMSLGTAGSTIRTVLNATGVLVHTNLGRAPLSRAAVDAVCRAAGHTNVEFNLSSGSRDRRGRGALDALAAAVPAAEDVHIVNNNAAALLLCALAMAEGGREIVVSRGEMVEIGDGFRIPELLESTGARIREVGTTNRTRLADYAAALGPDTAFVLKVHPSNYRIEGFVADVPLAELATLDVPVVADIGSGLLAPHPMLPDEPDAATAVRSGAALVTASADKLLGGPQAGLLLGKHVLVDKLRRHPSARALRVDKLTLAALESTLREPPVPVAARLDTDPTELRGRAATIAERLSAAGIDAHAVESHATIGGGGAPGRWLPSAAVSLPESVAPRLRTAEPAVVGRLEHSRCLLDLFAVTPDSDTALIEVVRRCMS
ncbi:L-seryl-tRNA(Sec) selenium transferase [Tamaricihabitans halophyticus]|uniref:L-seryl-tRNA(Sec) selenium transferase n=1 Tax=Tamaricihabitans halophyticus TaxID=1262583 RepID=A0A4R2Q1W5_9PSEU|nr:L-seryl-tRNA(Sec) selenium transferase [Tamaricihabitans halophyticus]TCP42632.1 L-seryl-tRNA(Sec) selenium transferase [Tamaricihabitans halophyticus]